MAFMRSALTMDPAVRISSRQAVCHPLFEGLFEDFALRHPHLQQCVDDVGGGAGGGTVALQGGTGSGSGGGQVGVSGGGGGRWGVSLNFCVPFVWIVYCDTLWYSFHVRHISELCAIGIISLFEDNPRNRA